MPPTNWSPRCPTTDQVFSLCLPIPPLQHDLISWIPRDSNPEPSIPPIALLGVCLHSPVVREIQLKFAPSTKFSLSRPSPVYSPRTDNSASRCKTSHRCWVADSVVSSTTSWCIRLDCCMPSSQKTVYSLAVCSPTGMPS